MIWHLWSMSWSSKISDVRVSHLCTPGNYQYGSILLVCRIQCKIDSCCTFAVIWHLWSISWSPKIWDVHVLHLCNPGNYHYRSILLVFRIQCKIYSCCTQLLWFDICGQISWSPSIQIKKRGGPTNVNSWTMMTIWIKQCWIFILCTGNKVIKTRNSEEGALMKDLFRLAVLPLDHAMLR